jgi:hypothetical protein
MAGHGPLRGPPRTPVPHCARATDQSQLGPERAAVLRRIRIEPFGGSWSVWLQHSTLATVPAAGVLLTTRRPGVRVRVGEPSAGTGATGRCTSCAPFRLETPGAYSLGTSRFTSHPQRHTRWRLGHRDGRPAAPPAESGAVSALARTRIPPLRPSVAALVPGGRRRLEGRRRVRGGRAATKAHTGKAWPARWKSRGGPPKRSRWAGEPSSGRRGPRLTGKDVMGLSPSHRDGRCLANSILAAGGASVLRLLSASTPGSSLSTDVLEGGSGAGLPCL